jgi:hypothetical protein
MPGKAHKPDRRTQELVSALALNGVAQSRVAEHIGISEPSLRKHYRRDGLPAISTASGALRRLARDLT